LQIGKMTLLSVEQVRFSYEILTEKTPAAGSLLTIEEIPGQITCEACGFTGPVELAGDAYVHLVFPSLGCPKCGVGSRITGGNDCVVKSIRMVAPEPTLGGSSGLSAASGASLHPL
jgi:hydrogenase nickel incorporation protein HypA/HybF